MAVNILLVHDMLEAFRKENMTRPLSAGVTVEPLSCSDPGELRLWLADYAGRIDGILFTNELLLRGMQERGTLPNIPCELVRPSGGDLLRMLTVSSGGVFRGSLARVLIDIGPGADLLNEILQTQLRPMILTHGTDTLHAGDSYADLLLRRYRSAWDGSTFDLIVMNHADLLVYLRAGGINAWCLLPGVDTICAAAERMALEIETTRGLDRFPVVVMAGIRSGRCTPEQLGDAAERYNAEAGGPFFVIRHRGSVELFGFGFPRERLIGGQEPSLLFAALRRLLGDVPSIGWGIGVDIVHARKTAMRAYRESLFDIDGSSFLVSETGELYGPFGAVPQPSAPADPPFSLRAAATRAGVSSLTMQRLCRAVDRMGTREVTSESLSRCLGVTRRSASRLLAGLVRSGAAQVSEETGDAARGRPPKRYRLLF